MDKTNVSVKNINHYQIALILAITVFFISILFLLQLRKWDLLLLGKPIIFLYGLSLSVLIFICAIYLFEIYIIKRIKIIYRNIHTVKISDIELPSNVDILQQVENEVEVWASNQIKELETLRALANYRRNYVGNISHELKTPIFNVQGYLETLIESELEDEAINMLYLKKANQNVNRLLTIIEDLDAINKYEASDIILEIQRFNIIALTHEVIQELELQAQKRNIKIILKDRFNGRLWAKGDMESIRQVLTNLISNSIKYGKENGRTKVSFTDMNKEILVEVADNGIGIPEKHLNHVFDRFFRVDKSRSRDVGGSGLGLSIVKHIIDAHMQRVSVRSSEGKGSTFGFTIEKSE
ncbi:MAG: sensor histidine kinase [Saprospiraceae bacterium]|nr:sensor histidine kinase [Saprospiraceae bacterium]